MKGRDELDKLIIEKCKISTFSDILNELGMSETQLCRRCKALGVKPIRGKERNINFIKANYQTMNAQDIADRLVLELYTLVHQYGKELKISFILDEEQKNRMWSEHNAKRVGNRFSQLLKASTPAVSSDPQKAPTKKTGKSPGDILAAFKMNEADHYYEPESDPISLERLKLRRDLEKLNIKIK